MFLLPAFVIVAVLGLAVGSFLNVVIHRVPRAESLVRPGSRWPALRNSHPGRAQNVPVFSWLALRGRCAASARGRSAPATRWWSWAWGCCGSCSPYRLVSAGLGWAVPAYLALAFICVVLAVIDASTRLLPNRITYPAFPIMLGLLLLASVGLGDLGRLARGLLAAVAVGAFFLALALISPARHGPWRRQARPHPRPGPRLAVVGGGRLRGLHRLPARRPRRPGRHRPARPQPQVAAALRSLAGRRRPARRPGRRGRGRLVRSAPSPGPKKRPSQGRSWAGRSHSRPPPVAPGPSARPKHSRETATRPERSSDSISAPPRYARPRCRSAAARSCSSGSGRLACPTARSSTVRSWTPPPSWRAIKDLWRRTRISSRRVIIGVANQRVVVRLVDLPWMPPAELRSSLGLPGRRLPADPGRPDRARLRGDRRARGRRRPAAAAGAAGRRPEGDARRAPPGGAGGQAPARRHRPQPDRAAALARPGGRVRRRRRGPSSTWGRA